MNLDNSQILITGGTGSLGKKLIFKLLNHSQKRFKRIVVFSRDELKQWELMQIYPPDKYPQMRFFLGDIRDKERLITALEGIDTVIHTAALKQVPAAEYNPMEFIKTNVIGSNNIIEASSLCGVKRVIALSTDKASAPVNLYGATKLCADKLFIAANNIVGSKETRFSVVRYGNVMGSRGSVIPLFIKKEKTGVLPITESSMTRFNITLNEGADLVLWAAENSLGREIFVPKIPSYKLMDVAEAIGPNCKKEIIGIRPGEKIHEELISRSESAFTLDMGKYFVILPDLKSFNFYCKQSGIDQKNRKKDFSYNSANNDDFLTIQKLRMLIKSNINID